MEKALGEEKRRVKEEEERKDFATRAKAWYVGLERDIKKVKEKMAE